MKTEKTKESEAVDNGNVDATQVAMWKQRHRKVYEISVVEDGTAYAGYFHRPDMETLAAVNKLGKTDEVKAATALFENCWLGGSSLLREDAVLKMAAISQLNRLMEVTRAEIKNL